MVELFERKENPSTIDGERENSIMTQLNLPERNHISRIDNHDPLPYYYSRLTGWMYRRRLILASRLLGNRRYGRLLEVGYGSGIFLPHLAALTDDLHALDIHTQFELVEAMLAHENMTATLHQGDIYGLPFEDGQFDALVCLSVLEHLTDLEVALGEIARVLSQDGLAVIGFPVRNIITDSFFRVAGFHPRDIHPSSHRDILEAADTVMQVDKIRRFPVWLPAGLGLYVAGRYLPD